MIKELRIKKDYTQEEMADMLKISLRHYVRIDNEKTIPRPDVLNNIINILDMNKNQIGSFIENVLKNKGLKRDN